MKIAFYKAKYGNAFDKLISFATFSPYSHCEMIFSDGMSASASPRDGGVRFKQIEYNDRWDIFDIKDDLNEAAIRYWFGIIDSDTYDFLGAIGSAFRLDLRSKNKKFCSYVCANVLGVDPIVSPGSLYRILVTEKLINV